jgi:hypothetical protein
VDRSRAVHLHRPLMEATALKPMSQVKPQQPFSRILCRPMRTGVTGATCTWRLCPDHQGAAAIASSSFKYLTDGKVCASSRTF